MVVLSDKKKNNDPPPFLDKEKLKIMSALPETNEWGCMGYANK